MEDIKDTIISTKLNELENIKFELNKKFKLNVKHNDYNYEFIVKIVDFDEDIIVFSPDFSNEKSSKNKPVFSNISWIDDLKCNVIYYNDPSLYDYKKLLGGWGIGTSKEWHLENIANILKFLSKNISENGKVGSLPYSNLFFYGSYMSGFMSLILSILVENSTSIVDEPFINLTSSDYWKTLKKECFDKFPKDVKYSNRVNIINLIQEKKTIPNTYIVFDVNNKRNWDKQYKYFLNETNKFPTQFNKYNNKINIRFEDKFDKFKPLHKDDTIFYINEVLMIQKRKRTFNGIKLQMINEFYERIDVFYNDLINKKISFDKFIQLNKNYYNTYGVCRIDIKNWGKEKNNVVVLEHDNQMRFETPQWFKDKKGNGILIHSDSSSIKMKFKCINDGKLRFELKGPDYTINNKKEPVYVCYNKLKINDELIFSKNFLTWHNLPYIYQKECKNNEIINLEVEFMTLNNEFPYLKQLIKNMGKEENIEDSFNKFRDYVKFLQMTNNPLDV